MSETYFTGDLHFYHRWMATHRGYDSVEEMNELLIAQWNDRISRKDDVFVLGDFSFGGAEGVNAVLKRLAGRHLYLIKGNHDNRSVTLHPRWSWVKDLHPFRLNGQTAWLLHYPMLTWPNANKGTWHLHGHSHGNLTAPASTRMDVGIDAIMDIAVSWDDVCLLMENREYDYVDHND